MRIARCRNADDRERFLADFDEFKSSEGDCIGEYAMQHGDGYEIMVEIVGRVEAAGNGTERVHCQLVEMTEPTIGGSNSPDWTTRDTDFSPTEERLKLAIEGAKLGVWDWNMKTEEVIRDELLTKMLGYSPEEMGDRLRDWERLVHPEGEKRHTEALEHHIANRTDHYQCDYRMRAKSGEWKWVRTMGRVVEWDEDGNPIRAVGIHQDIDDQKRNRLPLAQKTDQLEALNRVVRHDIRSDMNVIYGWATELEEHVDEEGEEGLKGVLAASRHVIELTEEAREFIATLGAEEDADLESIELRQQLRTELDKQREMYPEADFLIEGDLAAVSVRANKMLSSVFRNLLVNAVEHNQSDSPEVRVETDVRSAVVQIRIADNGPGIPDDWKEDIFGKGEKDPAAGGTGIGLYLVHSLVEAYGGEVWVEDNEPTGSVFVVELLKSG